MYALQMLRTLRARATPSMAHRLWTHRALARQPGTMALGGLGAVGAGCAVAVACAPATQGPWSAATDPSSGRTYYYNSDTGEVSWEKPAMEAKAAEPEVDPVRVERKVASRKEALRTRLSGMTASMLKKRARDAGAPNEDIKIANNAGDRKQALVDLVIRHEMEDEIRQAREQVYQEILEEQRREVLRAAAQRRKDEEERLRLEQIRAMEERVERQRNEKRAREERARIEASNRQAAAKIQEEKMRAEETKLRKELAGMELTQLEERAERDGATEAQRNLADDSDDPKQAFTELIVKAQKTRRAVSSRC
eukprot:COSAG02_NODE_11027_length_1809_cov_1.532164_2_plen_309_part_00